MKPDYALCDVCGKKANQSVSVTTDRRMDAAGSMDDVGEQFDLCPECLTHALNYMANLSHDEAKKLVAWVKAAKERKARKS